MLRIGCCIFVLVLVGCASSGKFDYDISTVQEEAELERYVGQKVSFSGRIERDRKTGCGYLITNGSVILGGPGLRLMPSDRKVVVAGVLRRSRPVPPPPTQEEKKRMLLQKVEHDKIIKQLESSNPDSPEAVAALRRMYEDLREAARKPRVSCEPCFWNYHIEAAK